MKWWTRHRIRFRTKRESRRQDADAVHETAGGDSAPSGFDHAAPQLGVGRTSGARAVDKTPHLPDAALDFHEPLYQILNPAQDVLAGVHGPISEPVRRQLEIILRNGDRLRHLVNQLVEPLPAELEDRFTPSLPVSPPTSKLTSSDAAFLNTLAADLDTHLTDPDYTVEVMAEHICLSTSQLQRRLRLLLNESPVRLIRRMRLEYAADMLDRDDGTVSEIACAAGFNSQSYFARAFKHHYGMTPSDYRLGERGA